MAQGELQEAVGMRGDAGDSELPASRPGKLAAPTSADAREEDAMNRLAVTAAQLRAVTRRGVLPSG